MSLISFGWFASSSGLQLPWKFDADFLSDETIDEIAKILQWKFAFSGVHAVPSDETPPKNPAGPRLAKALQRHKTPGYPLLIVDDVLTTGNSMNRFRAEIGASQSTTGFVICARGPCPNWIWPLFTINEWAQSQLSVPIKGP